MNLPAFTQIEAAPWPSGSAKIIAVARLRPELFARAFGLDFIEGGDNLGAYAVAPLRMRSGRVLGLVRRTGGSGSRTEVHADAADDFASALREFLDAFDLSEEDLSRMGDGIAAEQPRKAGKRARG